MRRIARSVLVTLAAGLIGAACKDKPPADRVRATGYVEATEVRVAAPVGGRLLELQVKEGDRIAQGQLLARLDVADTELAMQRAEAERQQAQAQLRLLQAGSRVEDVRQAEAHVQASGAEIAAAQAEVAAAQKDLDRFEALLRANAGSRKQRDDAETRLQVAQARVTALQEGQQAARAGVARLRSGARPQELETARARVAGVDAQLATLRKAIADATITAPVPGIVTERLADVGELIAPRAPLLVVTDLDAVWANVFIGEPDVPRITVGQTATVRTDAGGAGLSGTVTFVAPRAEFTPRNVQTAEERSKLVYRVKISVDNKQGILKPGMPVEAEIPFRR